MCQPTRAHSSSSWPHYGTTAASCSRYATGGGISAMTDFMHAIAEESDRFVRAIRLSEPDHNVPTCPDWSSDDLLWHLTEVHAFWAGILREGAQTDEESEVVEAGKPERPADRSAMIDVFGEQTATLLAELSKRQDADPAWFWLQTAKTVGSIRRMQAHEALMHRVDAELAAGIDSGSIERELAADGIAHAVEVMWAWWGTLPDFEFKPVAGVVELAASDLDRAWCLQPGRWLGVGQSGKSYDEPGAVLTSGGDARAAVTGTAEEIDRWLWNRGPEPGTSGDEASLTAVREAQKQGMQ